MNRKQNYHIYFIKQKNLDYRSPNDLDIKKMCIFVTDLITNKIYKLLRYTNYQKLMIIILTLYYGG